MLCAQTIVGFALHAVGCCAGLRAAACCVAVCVAVARKAQIVGPEMCLSDAAVE